MADIFICYSSQRRDLTRDLENRLRAEGYDSIWWDRELNPNAEFGPQIEEALKAAKVVIVIWTPEAVASAYVCAEARHAANDRKLVSVRTPDTPYNTIPKPFGEYHIAELADLDGILRGVSRAWQGLPPLNALLAEHYVRQTGQPVLSPKQERLSPVASLSPALLLNARLALAPYLDVHGRRAELVTWAKQGRPVRGRLIHGPGGLGKTRLMAEVAADLRREDWAAGFVEIPEAENAHSHRLALDQLIDTDRHAGLMLVLDYAERRLDEATRLAARMRAAAEARPGRPLRLVLLARAAGEWWERAVADTPALTPVFAGGVEALQPFPPSPERESLFLQARAGFIAAIDAAREIDPDAFPGWPLDARTLADRVRRDFASEAFARPLMIQIAALLDLHGEKPEANTVAALLDAMLGVERNYWRQALGAVHREDRHTALGRGATQSTLVGGVARRDAEALLLQDGYYARAAAAHVAEPLADLERVYGDGAGRVLPLEPDLVGEHLIAAEGDARLIDACLAWAGEDGARRRAILTVLQRATRPEHGHRAQVAQARLDEVLKSRAAPLAKDLVAVALETPGELANLMERAAPWLDPENAEALNKAIPQQTLNLMAAAGALAARAAAGETAADEAGRAMKARRLGNLGNRLSDLGRRAEALAATEEAVSILKELAAQNRDAFLPALALSLNNWGVDLSNLGRRAEALAATEEAVVLYRELANRNRDAFLPDLAMALNNWGNQLSNPGRRAEALTATEEAVAIRRELAAQNRDAFLPDLAKALNNLGITLSNLGRREEALTATEEAVTLYRELAARNRDAFLPDLATSLNNLGNQLSDLGRRAEALTASEEAVTLYRELAARNRDAFLPDLAMALNNWGNRLSNLGRRAEALTASDEAVTLYRELAAQNRDAVLPDLAMALKNLGVLLFNLGRREESLTATEEAVTIRRELAARNREAFLPDLARWLSMRGDVLMADGRADEAAASYRECLTLLQPYAEALPPFGALLTANLRDLVAAMRAAGSGEAAITDAVTHFGGDPAAFADESNQEDAP
jgi:tetratricopeptide (TPR) repeat protein